MRLPLTLTTITYLWLLPITVHASIELTELMPDPAGDDNAEWIELYNDGAEEISTEAWSVTIKTRTTKLPARTIGPQSFLVLTKTEAGFTLTNTGAQISLIDPAGLTVSTVDYPKAPTGQSYALFDNNWQWVKSPTPGTMNFLAPASAISTGSTTTLKVNYPLVEAGDIARLESGDKVTVEGTVVAAPGELSDSITFINGLQLNFTGDWPLLNRGDEIKIKGSVSNTKAYGHRLLIKSASDISVLSSNNSTTSLALPIDEITAEHESWLINTEGTVKDRGSNWFTLVNGENNIRVTLKNRDFKWPKYSNNINVTGLVTLSDGELRLWPRSPEDITSTNVALTQPAKHETIELTKEADADWRGYFVLAGLAVVLLGGWWYEKTGGSQLRKLIKKYFQKF